MMAASSRATPPCSSAVRIGRLAMLGGMAATSKDIPPFVLQQGYNCVTGLNVVGLRRAGCSPVTIDALRQAFRIFYREGRCQGGALDQIESDLGVDLRGRRVRGLHPPVEDRDQPGQRGRAGTAEPLNLRGRDTRRQAARPLRARSAPREVQSQISFARGPRARDPGRPGILPGRRRAFYGPVEVARSARRGDVGSAFTAGLEQTADTVELLGIQLSLGMRLPKALEEIGRGIGLFDLVDLLPGAVERDERAEHDEDHHGQAAVVPPGTGVRRPRPQTGRRISMNRTIPTSLSMVPRPGHSFHPVLRHEPFLPGECTYPGTIARQRTFRPRAVYSTG